VSDREMGRTSTKDREVGMMETFLARLGGVVKCLYVCVCVCVFVRMCVCVCVCVCEQNLITGTCLSSTRALGLRVPVSIHISVLPGLPTTAQGVERQPDQHDRQRGVCRTDGAYSTVRRGAVGLRLFLVLRAGCTDGCGGLFPRACLRPAIL
jgi:hypothetical protein